MKIKKAIKALLFSLPVGMALGAAAAFCSEMVFSRQQLQMWGAKVGGVLPLMAVIALVVTALVAVTAFCVGLKGGHNEK